MAVIFGTQQNDTLTGQDENDTIFGRAGDDLLIGRLGNDRIFGEAGNDNFDGGDGNDFLDGGVGDDRLNGGSGDDSLFGSSGKDSIYGHFGNDTIFGGNDADSLYGELDSDKIFGGDGNDYIDGVTYGIFGEATGRNEIDILTGGTGEDRFNLRGAAGRSGGVTYYDDGNSTTAGLNDYALMTDFDKSKDAILLPKTIGFNPVEANYILGASPSGLPQGTGLFIDKSGEQPELLAILQGVSPDSLNIHAPYFQLVS